MLQPGHPDRIWTRSRKAAQNNYINIRLHELVLESTQASTKIHAANQTQHTNSHYIAIDMPRARYLGTPQSVDGAGWTGWAGDYKRCPRI